MLIRPSRILTEEWGWDPEKKEWTEDSNVRCTNIQFQKKDKSVCLASIKPGKNHGPTNAASDYFYCIVSGTGKVKIEGEDSLFPIKEGDIFCIEEGTRYDYWADEDNDLYFVLYMSKRWDEE